MWRWLKNSRTYVWLSIINWTGGPTTQLCTRTWENFDRSVSAARCWRSSTCLTWQAPSCPLWFAEEAAFQPVTPVDSTNWSRKLALSLDAFRRLLRQWWRKEPPSPPRNGQTVENLLQEAESSGPVLLYEASLQKILPTNSHHLHKFTVFFCQVLLLYKDWFVLNCCKTFAKSLT